MGLGWNKPVENLIYDLSLLIYFFNKDLLHTTSTGIQLREDGICSSSSFFAVPKQVKHDPASGPLHWLILLPWDTLPQVIFMTRSLPYHL